MRVLLLGGTTEASQLAEVLAKNAFNAVFSYAGRTNTPSAQPLPTRIGGFGGVEGLTAYLRREGITHVVDATHPFAANMSGNAFAACRSIGLPLTRLERPAWHPEEGDNWRMFQNIEAIPDALPDAPTGVFLAIGKQQIGVFAAKPQHRYVLRFVDPPVNPLPLPNASVVIARGPFSVAEDTALMQDRGISVVVAKNGGGRGARAKLDAARNLGLPVLMADRPLLPGDEIARNTSEVMRWLGHPADLGV